MQNHKNNITAAEAKATLSSLAQINQDNDTSLRMPVWLNLITSCAYGMMIFSWASTRHENLWMIGLIISALVFSLAVGFYLYSNRLLGIKPKMLPKSRSELLFYVISAIFFAAVFTLTRLFSTNGMEWAAYIGAAIATLSLAFLLHHYPAGEFKKRATNHA